MSYHVDYVKTGHRRVAAPGFRRLVFTACLFILFCILVSDHWPEAVNVLRQTLVPMDTLQAAEVFAQELNCGYSLADAARNFLASIGAHGY